MAKHQIDKVLVDEVILFAENDYDCYQALINNYLPNLQKKRLNGTYDRPKSIKLLEYYYTNYVRRFMKMPRKYGFDPKLNPPERALLAKYFADFLYNEYLKNIKEKTKKKTVKKKNVVKKLKARQ